MAKLFKCNEGGVTEWCIAENKNAGYAFMKDLWGEGTMKEYENEYKGTLDEFIEDFFVEVADNEDFAIIGESGEVTKKASEWIAGEKQIPCWLCCEDF